MDERICVRFVVSPKYGVKVCMFDEDGARLFDKHTWYVMKSNNWKGETFYLMRTVKNGEKIKASTIGFHREFVLGTRVNCPRYFASHLNGNGLDNRGCNFKKLWRKDEKISVSEPSLPDKSMEWTDIFSNVGFNKVFM